MKTKFGLACCILSLLTWGCASKPKGPKPFDACAEMRATADKITALERESADYEDQVMKLNPNDSAEAGRITDYRIRMESNGEKKKSLVEYNERNARTCDDEMRKSDRYNNVEKQRSGPAER